VEGCVKISSPWAPVKPLRWVPESVDFGTVPDEDLCCVNWCLFSAGGGGQNQGFWDILVGHQRLPGTASRDRGRLVAALWETLTDCDPTFATATTLSPGDARAGPDQPSNDQRFSKTTAVTLFRITSHLAMCCIVHPLQFGLERAVRLKLHTLEML
jgi:hypothetical protein